MESVLLSDLNDHWNVRNIVTLTLQRSRISIRWVLSSSREYHEAAAVLDRTVFIWLWLHLVSLWPLWLWRLWFASIYSAVPVSTTHQQGMIALLICVVDTDDSIWFRSGCGLLPSTVRFPYPPHTSAGDDSPADLCGGFALAVVCFHLQCGSRIHHTHISRGW